MNTLRKIAVLEKFAVNLWALRDAVDAVKRRGVWLRTRTKQFKYLEDQGARAFPVRNGQMVDAHDRDLKLLAAPQLGHLAGKFLKEGDGFARTRRATEFVRRTAAAARDPAVLARFSPKVQTYLRSVASFGRAATPETAPGVRQNLSAAGREVLNRATILHENAELGKQFGAKRFSSHMSTRPALQDLNIAATLRGPGADAAPWIRAKRLNEMSDLLSDIPSLQRLDLGYQRVSRHAQRRIQQAYERSSAKY